MCHMLPPQQSKVFFYQIISCRRIFLMKLIILYSLWRNILLLYPKVHYLVHKSLLFSHILNQINTIHNCILCFSKIYLNIILPSMPMSPKWFLPSGVVIKLFCTLWIPLVHTNIPHPLHLYLFDYLESIW